MAQLIAGIDSSFIKARLRARLGSLFGSLTQAEGGERSARMLGAVMARLSPIMGGLGTSGLALALELTQAALSTSDPGAATPSPAGAGATPPQASPSADFAPIETMAMAEVSPRNVIAVAIGLSAAAWAHAHLVRPRSLRWRYRLRVPGGQPLRPGAITAADVRPPPLAVAVGGRG